MPGKVSRIKEEWEDWFMVYAAPHYYHRFRCIASDCPDTCCAGWSIMIDAPSLERYRGIKASIGSRIRNSIDWRRGCFKQYHGRCELLGDDMLCDAQRELGPGGLCRTCRTYPRHMEEYEGRREYSLCLSCVEAARLVLGCEEPVRFLSREDGREEDYRHFDFLLYTKLMDARDLAIQILQDRSMGIAARLSLCLGMAHDLQIRIRKGRLYEADALLGRYGRPDAAAVLRQSLGRKDCSPSCRFETMGDLYGVLLQMEVLNHEWTGIRSKLGEAIYGMGPKAYREQRLAFLGSGDLDRLPIWMEQLMVYFVYTYFCGAVYDGEAYGKMKLAVAGALLIEEMAQGVWAARGGCLEFSDVVDIAHRFSREMEHSDVNRGILESALAHSPSFSLWHLLGSLES